MRNPFRRHPDPFAASRYSDVVRSVRTRERKHMRHWWQWAILAVLVVVAGTAAYGTWLYYHTQGRIHVDVPTDPEAEGEPFNVLLVGSDSREGLTEEEQLKFGADPVGGQRADTLILAHVDPADESVIMVQFPRDLWVPIDGGAENKINAALEGGPKALVRTMKNLTGLEIHRYAQVNIAGFRDVVDAIGGVSVCIPDPIPFDPQTGLEITEDEVGMVKFDGEEALRFVRSRHFPTGDFQRIQNQQTFLAAAIDKVTSIGTLIRPDKIIRLLNIAGDNIKTSMSISKLRSTLDRFRSFDPEHYEAYTAPNFGTGRVGELSVVLPDMDTMKIMFDAIAHNQSPLEATGVPPIDPTTIRVGVYNGTFEEGVAFEAAQSLTEATDTGGGGVQVPEGEIANADRFSYKKSVIVYEPAARKMAELVAAAIPGAELKKGRTRPGVDVGVIVGRRPFTTTPIVQILPIPLPKPSEPPPECR